MRLLGNLSIEERSAQASLQQIRKKAPAKPRNNHTFGTTTKGPPCQQCAKHCRRARHANNVPNKTEGPALTTTRLPSTTEGQGNLGLKFLDLYKMVMASAVNVAVMVISDDGGW
jgi:hypothetical protein